jgi:hypothetical protein
MVGLGIELGAAARRQWWPEGALFAADFAGNRYMRDGKPIVAAEALTFARAGGKLAADSSGRWRTFAANELARTDLGALIEPEATNGLPNSALAGAQAGTTDLLDGLPAGWSTTKIDGTSFAARLLALDTWLGLPALVLHLWGDTTVSDTQIQFSSAASLTVAPGDTVLESLFVQCLAGSLDNISPRLRLTEQSAGGGYLAKQTSPFMPQAEADRAAALFTVGHAEAARASMALGFACTGAFDVTLRIAAPQMTLSSSSKPGSPILTSDGPLTRAADALTLNLPDESCDLTLNLADGSSLTMDGVSGAVALDAAEFDGVALRSAVAVAAA